MLDILGNPWFIGIAGGILSGLVVAFISRFFFSRRDRKEYLQKVTLANKDVLYAIRPGISEECIPQEEVIRSMISATARKYGVDESSMYNLDDIASELIKEVMDSSFISADVKKQFCEMLSTIREPTHGKTLISSESKLELSNRYRRQLVFTMSIFVGTLTMALAFVFNESENILVETEQVILLAVPAAVAVGTVILSVLLRDIQRVRLRRMELHVSKDEKTEKTEEKTR